MQSILVAFFSSLVIALLIIRFKHVHYAISSDWDLSGPQKFHNMIVPRIGGICIAFGLIFAVITSGKTTVASDKEIIILICAIPTFFIGLSEDLTKKISIRLRLLFTAASAILVFYLLQIGINRLGVASLDFIFIIPGISLILTIIAIVGLANAYNIIDGFHGLSSMVGVLTLLAIAIIGLKVRDFNIIFLSLIMISAIFGFFIWNYPRGLIFLGDGGAYLIGFWIASLSILLVYNHESVSPWFALLVNIYPIAETLFTIYRRKIYQGKSPGQPDGIHFHTLIYRRILNPRLNNKNIFSANARTAPYLWLLSVLGIIPAVLWWNSTLILIFSSLVFILCYLWLYKCIVHFKVPRWLHIR